MIKLSKKVLCLDWDKRSLRIVVARCGAGEMQLDDAHSHRIPTDVDSEDSQAMGKYIAQQLHQHHLKLNRVIVDVPRDKAVINRLSVPPTPLDELASAVRFQAMRELPFPLDEAQIDYVVTETNEQNHATQVLLAAVRSEVLERLRETCEAAGLTPARIGLRPYANMVSVTHLPAMLDRNVLFVDVGPSMTEIDVMCGNTLAFSRAANVSVPFQDGDLDRDDSAVISRDEISGPSLSVSVQSSAVDELLVEITRTLQAYRATDAAVNIEQIVVAGGTGIEQALLDAIDDRFNLPAILFDPTTALAVNPDEATKLRAFASTLGLAWGLGQQGLLELDFINPKKPIPPGQAIKRRLRIGGVAAAVLLLAGASWVVAERLELNGQLSDLRAETTELKEQCKANVEIEIKKLEAIEWDTEARAGVWLDHLLWLTRNLIEPGKKMLVEDVNFNIKNSNITVGLLCRDWEIATAYVKKLNDITDEDGLRLYKAEQGGWQDVKTIDADKFKGKVDVKIELLELTERKTIKQREKEYRGMKKIKYPANPAE